MIKEMRPLSLTETEKLAGDEVKAFIKKFSKLKYEEAVRLKEDIKKLENIKIKPEHVVKIIDLMPEDAQDLAKIFTDASLDENEINKILEIVKKYR